VKAKADVSTLNSAGIEIAVEKSKNVRFLNYMKRNYVLYLFLLPTVAYIFIFHYLPMYGVQIAFKDFLASKGIMGSPWVGFKYFERFLLSPDFGQIIWNTLGISLYSLIVGFPIPIVLALMLNYASNARFKKLVQTVSYAPFFISTVVMTGIIVMLLSPRTGILNVIINSLGGESVYFLAKPEYFKTIYVLTGIWQHTGWASIIYIAALAGVGMEFHEAAIVDGASKLQRIWYIDIPSILPTAIILFILQVGQLMDVGFEKTFLLQNPMNIQSSEVISTYVYKVGLLDIQYSFSAAVGLFNNAINFVLLILVNRLSRKYTETSLW